MDYRETGGRVIVVSNGSSLVEVRYSIIDDNLFEGTETFSAVLTVDSMWMSAGVQLGTPNRTVIEIQDDEGMPYVQTRVALCSHIRFTWIYCVCVCV